MLFLMPNQQCQSTTATTTITAVWLSATSIRQNQLNNSTSSLVTTEMGDHFAATEAIPQRVCTMSTGNAMVSTMIMQVTVSHKLTQLIVCMYVLTCLEKIFFGFLLHVALHYIMLYRTA